MSAVSICNVVRLCSVSADKVQTTVVCGQDCLCAFNSAWGRSTLTYFKVDILQRRVDTLTQQVATMTESYQELIEDLRERNSNSLIFLPFETLHQKILVDCTFSIGMFAQIIDHPNVTRLDRFILADVVISNEDNDHFTLVFSDDTDCRTPTGSNFNGTNWGGPVSADWDGKNQKAFVLFDASQENFSFPRWGQWT